MTHPQLRLAASLLLLAMLGYWSYQLLWPSGPYPWIFLDNLNLIIHEAGHWVFALFGTSAQLLGGSLLQAIVPTLFLAYFIYHRDLLGVSFCLFWLGNNIINISVYVQDAQTMELPLLGGNDTLHDWSQLFISWNALDRAELIGTALHRIGSMLLIGSLTILGYDLLQWSARNREEVASRPARQA